MNITNRIHLRATGCSREVHLHLFSTILYGKKDSATYMRLSTIEWASKSSLNIWNWLYDMNLLYLFRYISFILQKNIWQPNIYTGILPYHLTRLLSIQVWVSKNELIIVLNVNDFWMIDIRESCTSVWNFSPKIILWFYLETQFSQASFSWLNFYKKRTYQSDKSVMNVHLSVEVQMNLEMLSIGSSPKPRSQKHFKNHE